VKILSRIASAESWFDRFIRTYVLPKAINIPSIRALMAATVTGLDHALPRSVADRTG
jgi:hypothetical protein